MQTIRSIYWLALLCFSQVVAALAQESPKRMAPEDFPVLPWSWAPGRGLDSSKYVAAVGGADFVVGEFEDPAGQPCVMIVNKNLRRSTRFSMKFKEPGTILQTNSYTGVTEPWVGENNYLAAGQGMLLSLKK